MRSNRLIHLISSRFLGSLLVLSTCLLAMPVLAADDSAHLQAHKKTAPYYQDAQLCRSRSKVDPLPDGADPAITIDPSKYLTCINQMGYHQEAKTDPLLVAIQRCENQKQSRSRRVGKSLTVHPLRHRSEPVLQREDFPVRGPHPIQMRSSERTQNRLWVNPQHMPLFPCGKATQLQLR